MTQIIRYQIYLVYDKNVKKSIAFKKVPYRDMNSMGYDWNRLGIANIFDSLKTNVPCEKYTRLIIHGY